MKGGVQRNPLIYENGDPFFEYQYRTGPFLKIRNGGQSLKIRNILYGPPSYKSIPLKFMLKCQRWMHCSTPVKGLILAPILQPKQFQEESI